MNELADTYGFPINKWDVSQVKCFSGVFENQNTFNEPIHAWDTSNAKWMIRMFKNSNKVNQDISNWDTSQVELMQDMFKGATSFDKRYIKSWNLNNVVQGINKRAPVIQDRFQVANRNCPCRLARWVMALERHLI
jgi:surface protein